MESIIQKLYFLWSQGNINRGNFKGRHLPYDVDKQSRHSIEILNMWREDFDMIQQFFANEPKNPTMVLTFYGPEKEYFEDTFMYFLKMCYFEFKHNNLISDSVTKIQLDTIIKRVLIDADIKICRSKHNDVVFSEQLLYLAAVQSCEDRTSISFFSALVNLMLFYVNKGFYS
jgi:hypothetical protein